MLSTFVPGQKYCIVSTILLVTAESLLAFPLAPRIHNNSHNHHHNHNYNHVTLRRSSMGTRPGMVGQKRKYVSDGVDVLESFEALQGDHPEDVHTLLLGTLPSDKSYGQNLTPREIRLRGGEGHQNYGHSRNSFWHIVGSAFGFLRHQTPFAQQVAVLTRAGYSVWDVLSQAKRKGSLDANLVKGSLTPTDLPKFLLEHPNLNRFVFAANSAEVFCKPEVWGDWLATGEATATTNPTNTTAATAPVQTKFWMQGRELNPETFARTNAIFGKKKAVEVVDDPALSKAYSKLCTISGDHDEENDSLFLTPDGTSPSTTSRRLVELIVMPSTSPANARMRPPEKEKTWHKACYRLREPPKHYVCPGCEYHSQTASTSNNKDDELLERHWFHDCPYREDWKLAKKQQQSKKKSYDDDDEIDPFYWYT